MTDRLEFETRLEERLRARAALASRPFDAARIAQVAITAGARRRAIGGLEWPSMSLSSGWLAVALLLALAVLGAIAGIGALLRQQPPPFLSSVVSNGRIAVSANPNGIGSGEAGDIYLVAPGAAARRIIGSDADGVAQACPRFSPDGGRLAYGEGRPSPQPGDNPLRGMASVTDRAVVVVGLKVQGDASPPIMRGDLPRVPGQIACPEWSPTGRHVAYRFGAELWAVDVSSGETTVFLVTEAPWGQQGFEWSRDGSRIAVSEPGRIRVVRMDGDAPTVIPVQGATPAYLGWAPGDARIIYITTDEPGDGLAIHVVDADGRNDVQLTPTEAELQERFYHAVLSPDGSRMAYVQRSFRCTNDGCSQDPEQLVTMDLDGSNVVPLSIPAGYGTSGLQWSPDGQRLLLGSGPGVVSIGIAQGSPMVVHSSGELNLEWSGSQVSWQPVFQ